MALIQCPECGQTVSDKAEKCPNCGCPILQAEKAPVVEAEVHESEQSIVTKQRTKKPIILIVVILALAVGLAALFVIGELIPTDVSDIKIARWKVIDTTSYGNYYEAVVNSDQKKPFAAVIGSYKDGKAEPQSIVFVNNGEGKFEVYASEDSDPSIEYYPIGYYQTQKVKASEVSVKYKDRDYSDYSSLDETDCYVDIEIELNDGRDGILLVNIENITNKEKNQNLTIPVVNGVGKYTYYAELPYKSRGIEISVTPVCFIKSQQLKDADYTVEKPFSVNKVDGKYSSYYDGEGTWAFEKFDNGLILYSKKLTDGGNRLKRGETNYYLTRLYNHEVEITSYDSGGDDILMPKYEIHMIGYLPWIELIKE